MKDAIFISYRREDTAAHARSIYQSLVSHFGKTKVFLDIDTIEKGENFKKALDEHLARSAALVSIIGKQWLCLEADGTRSVSAFVRMEIATALARKVPVLPVLVDGSELPAADLLPPDLRELVDLQTTRISHDSYAADVSQLRRSIARRITEQLGAAGRIAYLLRRGRSRIALPAALLGATVSYGLLSSDPAAHDFPRFPDNEYGIIVTEIPENAGAASSADRSVTQILVDSMGDLLNEAPVSGNKTIKIAALGQALPTAHGHEAAADLARRSNAKLVVWGWYSKDVHNVLIRVNADYGAPETLAAPFVENLDDPRVTPENYVEMFGSLVERPRVDQIFNLAFTVSSAQEAAASAALLVGFVAYTRGEFGQAEALLTALTEPNKRVSPLVRAYTHFLLGNIKLARISAGESPGDVGDALPSFITANEWLDDSSDHARALRAKIANNIGAVLICLGDYEQADAFVTRSLQQSSDNATAHANKGRILLARAGLDDSHGYGLPLFEDPEARRSKAEIDGIASMEKSLSINPKLLMPRLWLVKVALSRGDAKKATEQLAAVFDAFRALDPQHASLPDRAVLAFMHEFGSEFSADLVSPENRSRVLAVLTDYLREQERLYHMFSTMDPHAMSMAGSNMARATTAIARLKNEAPASPVSRRSRTSVKSSDGPPPYRKEVQDAISDGRREDATRLLSKVASDTDDLDARYALGKLLFEAGDRRGAYQAISSAIDAEIKHYSRESTPWTVAFHDGERPSTYAGYVDILVQCIEDQGQYRSAVTNLVQRVHLLGSRELAAILSLRQFDLPREQRVELLQNLGGALGRDGRFAEAAEVFAEIRHEPDPDLARALTMTLSELKMRAASWQPMETLRALLEAAEHHLENQRSAVGEFQLRCLERLLGLWHCELALRSNKQEDARCMTALVDPGEPDDAEESNDDVLAGYYRGRFALRRGDEAEWLRQWEQVIQNTDAYRSLAGFNRVDLAPQDANLIFDSMFRELVAYYRRSSRYEGIGRLLFRRFDGSYMIYERERLDALRRVDRAGSPTAPASVTVSRSSDP